MKKIILTVVLLAAFFISPFTAFSGDKLIMEFPKNPEKIKMVKEEGDKNTVVTVTTRSGECFQYQMFEAKFVAFRRCGDEEWNTNVQIY